MKHCSGTTWRNKTRNWTLPPRKDFCFENANNWKSQHRTTTFSSRSGVGRWSRKEKIARWSVSTSRSVNRVKWTKNKSAVKMEEICSASEKLNDVEDDLPSIANFLAGKNVFITGGTGFLGTVLIERLLSSTPDIGKVYVLIRDKNGHSASSRIERLMAKVVSSHKICGSSSCAAYNISANRINKKWSVGFWRGSNYFYAWLQSQNYSLMAKKS